MSRCCALILMLLAGLFSRAYAQQPQEIPPETVHAVVETMMRAAIGADFDVEERLRKDMTQREQIERSQALAAHRAVTFPWVMAAFGADQETILDYLYPNQEKPGAQPVSSPAHRPAWEPQAAYDAMLSDSPGWEYVSYLEQMGAFGAKDGLELTQEICRLWLEQIDPQALERINRYYSMWIYMPDSQIDYPIVHGPDNGYWLHRLFNGEYNSAGTLFVDYRNLKDFQDPNTLIYGHHMRNDSMFGDLTEYQQQIYFDTHPWCILITPQEVYIAEVFAGYATRSDDHCYNIAISGEQDFLDFVLKAQEKTDFVSLIAPVPGDRLITLSTCAYMFDRARYIVIARLTQVKDFLEKPRFIQAVQ